MGEVHLATRWHAAQQLQGHVCRVHLQMLRAGALHECDGGGVQRTAEAQNAAARLVADVQHDGLVGHTSGAQRGRRAREACRLPIRPVAELETCCQLQNGVHHECVRITRQPYGGRRAVHEAELTRPREDQLSKSPSQRGVPFEKAHVEKAHRVVQLNRWRPVTSSEDVRSANTQQGVRPWWYLERHRGGRRGSHPGKGIEGGEATETEVAAKAIVVGGGSKGDGGVRVGVALCRTRTECRSGERYYDTNCRTMFASLF